MVRSEPRNSVSVSGFTLVELLIVVLIISILAMLSLTGLEKLRSQGVQTDCASHLHQLHLGFTAYQSEYRRYPSFAPPQGLGDRYNWQDLWISSDPAGGAIWFSGSDSNGNGVADGNETINPRVPRLLAEYTGSVDVLHCSSQGESSFWFDVGPYYYNTTSPFPTGSPFSTWRAKAGDFGQNPKEPLAACQSPDLAAASTASWKHGKIGISTTDGVNQHLYTSGAVESLTNPPAWLEP